MSKIELVNACKQYIKNRETIQIFENINVKLENGKVYAITGNSGVGKTTLLNIIGTIDKLSSGKILIDGQEIKDLKENEIAHLRMEKIGFIFQEFYLNKNMTVEENIMQPMYINEKYTKQIMRQRTEELIKMIGLTERKKHFPKELSGGEQQRVAIARALANDPDIILADEPTGNLDKENEKNIFDILHNLSTKGKCVIVVSHSNTIKQYADIILKLNEKNLEIETN